MCILGARNREGDCEREQGYYSGYVVGFVSSFLLDNRKEGLVVRGGRSPNWVNHVYLYLSSFMCFPHILCVALLCNI